MDNTNGTQNFAIRLTLDEMRRNAEEVRNTFRNIGNSAEAEGVRIDQVFKNIGKTVAGVFTAQAAMNFARQVASVRGEFQQLEVAFRTMLGSAEKADALMSQLVRTAAITPFDLQGVANGAKQLLAYGLASDKVNETLIRLGDIAAGLSIPLNDLVYLYGTTMTQGRLFTQDLRQFMGRGIPLADELAKQFGVTKDKVGELVTAGRVGFPEVQKAIEAMTDEGGKFGGLMEAQSKTITGQISNIEDAISIMFNEIGKANEGIINDALSGVSYLVENYEKVGKEIAGLVVAYGAYKAVLMSVAAYQGAVAATKAIVEAEGLSKLLTVEQQAAISKRNLTKGTLEYATAVKTEITANIEAQTAALAKARTEVSAASKNIAVKKAEYLAARELEKQRLAELMSIGATGTAKQVEAAERKLVAAETARETAALQYQAATRDFSTKKVAVETAAKTLNTTQTAANTAAQIADAKSTDMLTIAKTKLSAASKALGLSMLTNPYVLAAVAIAGLVYGIYKLVTAETAAEKAQNQLNKELEEAAHRKEKLTSKTDSLISKIDSETESVYSQVKAYKELKKLYPELGNMTFEEFKNMPQDRQKKMFSSINEKREMDDAVKAYEADLKRIEYLNEAISETAKLPNSGLAYSKLNEELETANNLARLHKEEIDKIRDAQWEANTPVEEKVKHYEDVKKRLVEERDEIVKSLEKSEDVASVWMGMPDIISGIRLDSLNKQIDETTGKIESLTGVSSINYKKAYDEAKKDWEDAKKKLSEIEKNKSKYTTAEYDTAKKNVDTAEKTYKDLGGVTGSSLTKQENQAKKEAEKRKKAKEKLDEELLSLERQNQQDDINLKEDGTKKKLAQIKLDFDKQGDAIRKRVKELAEANKEAGKTDVNKDGLTTDQQNAIDKAVKLNADTSAKAREKVEKEELESNRRTWQEYFIEFGNYQEKRKNLIEKYDDEIAKLQKDSPEYAIKVAEKDRALEQLDEQYGKSTRAMADLFEDASDKSVTAIQSIIDKYETLVAYLSGGGDVSLDDLKGIGFTDKDIASIEKGKISIKDVTDALKGLKNELKGKSPWLLFEADLDKAVKTLKESKGESVKIREGITGIGNAVSSFAPALKEFGSNIANIFGIDDSKITGAIDALDGLGQTASGVGQIMSGDIVGGAMSAVSGISSVVSAFEGLFGADYSRYNRMVEEYDALNDVWDRLIDKKQEYIDISYGDEARKVGKEVEELMNRQLQSNVVLGKERLNSGASVGSHSIGVRQRKGMSDQGWKELREAARTIGFNYGKVADGRMEGLFDLSAKQLERLQEEAPTFWAKLDDDVKEYLQNIIDCGSAIEENKQKMNETFTGVSFDSFYDNFVSILSDMDKSSEDFADSFGDYLRNALLQNLLANKYKQRIQDLYDAWAAKSDSNGDGIFDLTSEEADELKKAQQALAEQIMAERDAMAESFGWKSESESSERTATAKGIAQASQDSVDELNGRFTTIQGHTYSISENMVKLAELQQTHLPFLQNLSYLAPIEENTYYCRRLDGMDTDLRAIKQTLENIELRGITVRP